MTLFGTHILTVFQRVLEQANQLGFDKECYCVR